MQLFVKNRILDLSVTQIMGILNVTPDSFFDGNNYCVLDKAIDHTAGMIKNGATLIDIGGESTRPGASAVSEEEEAERVLPVVHAIVKRFDVFVSVNTSSALVICESAAAGAHLINDVRALTFRESIQAVAKSDLLVCLMHMQGTPATMQSAPTYLNIVREVDDYFAKQIIRCESERISRTRLLLDPGFGFGKNLTHNYQLLASLKCFHHFNLPLLVGMSRKSMLRGKNFYAPCQRLIGSVACAVIAALQGVQIIRVHDVKETAEALEIVMMMQKQLNKKI